MTVAVSSDVRMLTRTNHPTGSLKAPMGGAWSAQRAWRALRGVGVAAFVAMGLLAAIGSGAMAASTISLCVPKGEYQGTITGGKHGCPRHYTAVTLNSEGKEGKQGPQG